MSNHPVAIKAALKWKQNEDARRRAEGTETQGLDYMTTNGGVQMVEFEERIAIMTEYRDIREAIGQAAPRSRHHDKSGGIDTRGGLKSK